MFIRDRKLRISVFAAILFFIISNPEMFKFVRQLLGSWVSNESGCPTTQGLLLHTVVYLLITYALMNDGRELLEGQEGAEAEGAEDATAEDAEGAEGAEASVSVPLSPPSSSPPTVACRPPRLFFLADLAPPADGSNGTISGTSLTLRSSKRHAQPGACL